MQAMATTSPHEALPIPPKLSLSSARDPAHKPPGRAFMHANASSSSAERRATRKAKPNAETPCSRASHHVANAPTIRHTAPRSRGAADGTLRGSLSV